MYKTENLTINGGNLAPGAACTFDLVIKSLWCKIVAVKIVQIVPGDMDVIIQFWESTIAQTNPLDRTYFYQLPYQRRITLTVAEGGQYAESLAGEPMPYWDRDTVDEERTYRLHGRLENLVGGTASDFAVSITIADIGEGV